MSPRSVWANSRPCQKIVVAALYKFTALPDFADHRAPLLAAAQKADIRGTLLLAHEGINGTIAGTRDGIDAVLSASLNLCLVATDLEWKESYTDENPFLSA